MWGLGPSSYSPMFGSIYGHGCPENPRFGIGELGYGGWARFGRSHPRFGNISSAVHTQRPGFGSDVSDAVLAYRKLWNDYVMATIRGMDLGSTALINLANSPPSGFTADDLHSLGQDYADERDALQGAWNQFAGKTTDDMTAEGAVMLGAFQQTVADAQKFWASDKKNTLHVAGSEPPSPSPFAQAAVKAQIDASGAMNRSSLSLAIQSTTGITPPSIPSAGDVGNALARFAKDHWVGIGVAVIGVGLGLKAASLLGRGYLKVATGGLL